jgi:serine/threonine protein kinase/Tfp pilus assembly protein PilF
MLDQAGDVKAIFLAAVGQGTAREREAYVQKACEGNAGLLKRVQELLSVHDESYGPLDAPPPAHGLAHLPRTTEVPVAETAGTIIGPYKLLEQIGEGGFGVVFMAQQQEPIRRTVALKVLKPGMDTRQVIARFEAERQALALMDHPNIARVLDAGQTTSDRPFFVMDLVKGLAITDYCDQSQFTTRERLELFGHVCQAVQHAHQKGIIHRDLKPSNVMVTVHDGTPLVKVIDFGIAKTLGQQLTDKTLYTGFAQMIGTPLYMSPEQAALSNADVDTRSDIYSLGVLLYELLTGTTPFDKRRINNAGYDEMRRIIREEEPPKPSTRFSTLGEAATTASTQRKRDVRRLSRVFRGELDWIVMKALEKDRNRRYESAGAFAADVERYLNDLPVHASPPSARYRFGKFARRNKVALLTAAIVALTLLAGTGTSTYFSIQANHRAKEAEQALRRARRALDNMSSHVIDDWLARQENLTVEQKRFLEDALASYEELSRESGDTPELRMALGAAHLRVGSIRLRLGLLAEAEAAYAQAIGLFQKLTAEFPNKPGYRQDLATIHNNLGLVLADLGKEAEAGAEYRAALTMQEKLATDFPKVPAYRVELARTRGNLGNLLAVLGKRGEAEVEFRAALTILERLAAEFPAVPTYRLGLAKNHHNLGTLLAGLNKRDEAEPEVRSALTIQAKLAADFPTVPEYGVDLAKYHNLLAALLDCLGNGVEAAAEVRSALRVQSKLAAEFPNVPDYRVGLASSHHNLAVLLGRLDKGDEAQAEYRAALAVQEKLAAEFPTVPDYRHDLASNHSGLGDVLDRLDKRGEAEAEYRVALAVQEKLAAEFPNVPAYLHELGRSHFRLGVILHSLGELDAAEAENRAAVIILESLAGDSLDVPDYAVELGGSLCNFGVFEGANGRPEEALEWFAQAVRVLERVLAKHGRMADARQFLRNAHGGRAQVLDRLNRFAEAADDWDLAIELDAGPNRSQIRRFRAFSLARAGDHAEAVTEATSLAAEQGVSGGTLYDLACVVSLASAAVKDDAKLCEQYSARTVDLLRMAKSAAFFENQMNIEHMKQDSDLDSIRDRDDYKKFVHSLTPE